MTKGQRRQEQRMRAALRGLSIVASGPNDPSGARVPLPSAGTPQFTDPTVREVWLEQVFKDPYLHLQHRVPTRQQKIQKSSSWAFDNDIKPAPSLVTQL